MRRTPWGFLLASILLGQPAAATDLATRLDQQDRFVADHEALRAELEAVGERASADPEAALRAYRIVALRAADRAETQIDQGFYGFQCRHLLDVAARALHDHRELLFAVGDRRYRAELARLRTGVGTPDAPVMADPELGGLARRLAEAAEDPLLARLAGLRDRARTLLDPPYPPEPDASATAEALAAQPARMLDLVHAAAELPGIEADYRPLRVRRDLEHRFAELAGRQEEAREHLAGNDAETARLALATIEGEREALAVEVDRVRRRFGDHPNLDRLDLQLEGLRIAGTTLRADVHRASRRDD